MKKYPYLKSRTRRGRWFHYYQRNGRETPLGVHGLHPTDPRVVSAWAAEHARWNEAPVGTETPKAGTFAWALDLYTSGNSKWLKEYSEGTRKSRSAIFERYRKSDGSRPIATIRTEDIEAFLYQKGGHGAVNELKALKPVFAHMKKLGFIARDPMASVQLEKPKSKGFLTASPECIEKFRSFWPVGTVERLIFDLALYTGAARHDLSNLSRKNLRNDILVYTRQKTGTTARVPVTKELREVISRSADIAPAFILNKYGRKFSPESLGNLFGTAARAAGIEARLHGLRKAFCVYWAEQGRSTHEIAAMAGHLTLSEVERYTKAVDNDLMIQALARDL